jgi:hypothetical protein
MPAPFDGIVVAIETLPSDARKAIRVASRWDCRDVIPVSSPSDIEHGGKDLIHADCAPDDPRPFIDLAPD